MTAPWAPVDLAGALSLPTSVTVAGEPLDVITGTITFDEDTTPHIQASLTAKAPTTQLALDLLDPRLGARLVVTAGYALPGQEPDVHTLVDLGLYERVVTRPDNTVTLTAVSDEQLVQAGTPVTGSVSFNATSRAGDAIAALIARAVPTATVAIDPAAQVAFVNGADSMAIGPGEGLWDAIQTIADRASLWVYHDGLGVWHVQAQATAPGAASASLAVGPLGTITASETALSVRDFYNTVHVTYRWFDGTQHEVTGWAQITSGPLSVAAIGRRTITQVIDSTGTTAMAQAAAAAMLSRALSRGRSMRVDAAHAAWWLRPGQAITVTLPLGGQERHLVARVDFDIPTATMTVRTRVPDATATLTTGA